MNISKKLDHELQLLEDEVVKGTQFFSDSEDEVYKRNFSAKKKLMSFLVDCNVMKMQNKINQDCYALIHDRVLKIFSKNTGCAEDLEIFDELFEPMFQKKILNEGDYKKVVESSPVNRWF